MAEIKLCSIRRSNGCDIAGEISAWLGEREWLSGGKTPVLRISVGNDTLEIWPADKERLRELGERLIALSEKITWQW